MAENNTRFGPFVDYASCRTSGTIIIMLLQRCFAKFQSADAIWTRDNLAIYLDCPITEISKREEGAIRTQRIAHFGAYKAT